MAMKILLHSQGFATVNSWIFAAKRFARTVGFSKIDRLLHSASGVVFQ
jgi:hypothetical protein